MNVYTAVCIEYIVVGGRGWRGTYAAQLPHTHATHTRVHGKVFLVNVRGNENKRISL